MLFRPEQTTLYRLVEQSAATFFAQWRTSLKFRHAAGEFVYARQALGLNSGFGFLSTV